MMTHSFLTADLAAERTRTLRAEADSHRLALLAARARVAAPGESPERPRRWARMWRQLNARPA